MDEKAPKTIRMNEEEFGAFRKRLEQSSLSREDQNFILQIFQAMRWLSQQLEIGRLTISRLQRLIFGKKTESRENILGDKGEQSTPCSQEENAANCDPSSGIPKNAEPANKPDVTEGSCEKSDKNQEPPKPGHGRNGQSEYTGAERILCTHPNLKAGDICPDCGKGKLHDSIPPGTFVRFVGHSPLSATVYETEKLRCALCGKIFEAPLPFGVKAEKWDETAKTTAALTRYGYGFPHTRLEKYQTNIGVPVSNSVLFELSQDVADCGRRVYRVLVDRGAQGSLVHYDDMDIKILELMKENKLRDPDKERVGMFTTAMISRVEEREIALFFTGRNHAGENIVALLKKRTPGADPPMLMCDGSSRNPPDDFKVILANCLTHGRRNFVDLKEAFPDEIKYVINVFAEIYRNDAIAKEMAMNEEERLRFHQEKSGPFIEELKKWCHDQLEQKKVEPNGPFFIERVASSIGHSMGPRSETCS